MKRCIISVVLVLVFSGPAWVQEARPAAEGRQGGQRFQNLSDEERARMRERFQNMSEADREKFRAEMRQRFGSGGRGLGREEQLKAIEAIEQQVAKLKATVAEAMEPQARVRDIPEAERAKLREKMAAAMRQRQQAIRAIEEELAKLKGPGQQGRPEPRASLGQLKAIHELAVKENATQTAGRLEKLIAGYQSQSTDSTRDPEQRPPRDRLVRPEKVEEADSGRKAPDFKLNSFEGKTISLSDYSGKIVVLEWFNFECPFVMYHYDKTTTMIDLAKKYKDRNVVWLAMNSTSHTTPGANIGFAGKHKLPYPILDDRSGKVGHAYGAKTTPHMFIVNQTGNIVYEGAIDNSPNGRTAPDKSRPTMLMRP